MKTTKCLKCNQEIRNCNVAKHSKKCNNEIKHVPGECRYCKSKHPLNEMANHTRWCKLNPKFDEYREIADWGNAISAMRDARIASGKTNQFTKAEIEGTVKPVSYWKGKEGFFKGRKHTEKTKQLQREKALASPHRRLRRKMIQYEMVDGGTVMLDSSWEEALALRLDETNIRWIRPDPIKWVDAENVAHNFFPDFYLLDYDLYLDPKNPYAAKVQKEKIDILDKMYDNIIWLNSIEKCKQFILPVPHRGSTPTSTE